MGEGGFYQKDEELRKKIDSICFIIYTIRIMVWRLVVQGLALAHEALARRDGTMVN